MKPQRQSIWKDVVLLLVYVVAGSATGIFIAQQLIEHFGTGK